MTNESRDLFVFKTVGEHEPLCEDPFYAWLDANVTRVKPGRYIDHCLAYLGELGFVRGKNRVSEEQLQTLKYVHEIWCQFTPFFEPKARADLFDSSEPTYYIHGYGRSGATCELVKMVRETGWIYEVTPDTTYFEILDGRLYAKYQQIIGSCFICRIKEG